MTCFDTLLALASFLLLMAGSANLSIASLLPPCMGFSVQPPAFALYWVWLAQLTR